MNNQTDWAIAQEQHWYRIPIEQVGKLKQRQQWAPPQWLAFYQTKAFGQEAYSIQYFARVRTIGEVSRKELFPQELDSKKSQKFYVKVELEPVQRLIEPIKSDRLRRITFIATTLEKLVQSHEMKEL